MFLSEHNSGEVNNYMYNWKYNNFHGTPCYYSNPQEKVIKNKKVQQCTKSFEEYLEELREK